MTYIVEEKSVTVFVGVDGEEYRSRREAVVSFVKRGWADWLYQNSEGLSQSAAIELADRVVDDRHRLFSMLVELDDAKLISGD